MHVLAINCGSSSLKCELVDVSDADPNVETRLARASVEHIGASASLDVEHANGRRERTTESIRDHATAVERVIARLRPRERVGAAPLALGHRVVHGGARFVEPTRIDREVEHAITNLAGIAPLHNAVALAAIEAASAALPGVPAVAVFDTAFHRHMPARARELSLPHELVERHALRRVGFHGLAHRSMCEQYARMHPGGGEQKIVTLQLGHGVSAAAIMGGKSIDTSMGFSPLEGLMMGTRSGDLDPALVAHLAHHENASAGEIVALLNTRAGLLGVSGRSANMRELLEAAAAGDARCELAVEMFVYRIQKCVGAYLAALHGADAIVFGGGIGERSAVIRARVCEALEWCGLALDANANTTAHTTANGATRISGAGSALEAWVIPVDEERLIARDTASCLMSTHRRSNDVT